MNKNNTKTNSATKVTVKVSPGRNPLNVTYPKGAFTVEQLFALNSQANGGPVKCELTIRNHIKKALASGKIVRLPEKAVTGTVGAPAFRFQLKSAADYNAARKNKSKVVEATPAVTEAPVA